MPLKEELAFARTYLEIEKARFGERLQFTLPSETEADGLSLPSLTIQPIVENAVRHGSAGGSKEARLWSASIVRRIGSC